MVLGKLSLLEYNALILLANEPHQVKQANKKLFKLSLKSHHTLGSK